MRFAPMPSLEELQSLLDLNAATGVLTWKSREEITGNGFFRRYAGTEAGNIRPTGYRYVKIGVRSYAAHRIVWTMFTGSPPIAVIDHIDRNKLNNAPGNLRAATWGQNCTNRVTISQTGFKGVSRLRGRWAVTVKKDGKKIKAGYFPCPTLAAIAYDRVARSVHGEFAILNFPSIEEGRCDK